MSDTTAPYGSSAKRYLKLGWFPIPVAGKAYPEPGTTGKRGVVTAKSAKALIETRRTRNVALRHDGTTMSLDIDGADHDGKHGDRTLADLERERGALPPSWSSTARGADSPTRQVFYRVPEGTKLVSDLGPDSDVEVIHHDHRYSVVAPSVHPDTGALYEWYDPKGRQSAHPPHVDELAALPRKWLEALTVTPYKATAERPSRSGITDNGRRGGYLHTAIEGNLAQLDAMSAAATPRPEDYRGEPWDITTHAVACRLIELANAEWAGLTLDQAFEAFIEHAPVDGGFNPADKWAAALTTIGDKAAPAPDLTPAPEVTTLDLPREREVAKGLPSPAELQRGDESAYDRAVRRRAEQLAIDDEARRRRHLERRGERPHLRDRLLTVKGLNRLEPPEPLIDGVLMRDSIAELVGPSGIGKTFLALDLALSVAAGRPWMGHAVRKGRALYVMAEGATGARARIAAWETGWQTKVPRDAFHLLPQAVNLADPLDTDDLVEAVSDLGIDIIVIDTLARASGQQEENSSTAMGVIIDALERLREAHSGACVLAVHHEGKTGTGGRGSSAVYAAMTTVLTATGDSSSFKVDIAKQKDGPEGTLGSYKLAPVEGSDSMVVTRVLDGQWRADLAELAPRREEALEHFRRAFGATGATRSEFRSALEGYGFTRQTAYRVINDLVSAGALLLHGTQRLELPPTLSSIDE